MQQTLSSDQQITIAEHAFNSGNINFSVQTLRLALRQAPSNPKAHELLAQIALKQGDTLQAAESLTTAIKHPNASFKSYFFLGTIYNSQGRFADATRYLKHALSMDGGVFFECLHNLANSLSQQKLWTEAIQFMDRAVALSGDHPEVRNSHGVILQNLSRHEDAIVSFQKAVSAAPQHAGAWLSLGKSHFTLQYFPEAAHAFKQAIRFGESQGEEFLATSRYLLAAVSTEMAPDKSPEHYVKNLFDGFSETFDKTLVEQLNYQTPTVIISNLEGLLPNHELAVLDLGCGTGLCGRLIREKSKTLDGVDLSPGMLEKARELQIYDNLVCDDIHKHLLKQNAQYDLIIAADVFIYIGRLDAIFEIIGKALKPGGILSFSIERSEHAPDFFLTSTGRYTHSEAYIERLSASYRFKILKKVSAPIRTERGETVEGVCFYLAP